MAQVDAKRPIVDEGYKKFLAEFSKTFGASSPNRSNVRCISKTNLIEELVALAKRYLPSQVSGRALLEFLLESGLVHSVPLNDLDGKELSPKLYLIGLNETAKDLHPIELLHATLPYGIVCYFTAIQFHELTTQVPSHHQIARLIDSSSERRENPTSTDIRQAPRLQAPNTRSRLGTFQFHFRGTPYYTTNRERAKVPGTQQYYFSDKSIFSVTTLEQTLLDTLNRPFSCGGPSVVFEAWNNASDILDQSRILDYLRGMRDNRLSRRVGYFLIDNLQLKLNTELKRYFHTILRKIKSDGTDATISLLPGYKYAHENSDWWLEVP